MFLLNPKFKFFSVWVIQIFDFSLEHKSDEKTLTRPKWS